MQLGAISIVIVCYSTTTKEKKEGKKESDTNKIESNSVEDFCEKLTL